MQQIKALKHQLRDELGTRQLLEKGADAAALHECEANIGNIRSKLQALSEQMYGDSTKLGKDVRAFDGDVDFDSVCHEADFKYIDEVMSTRITSLDQIDFAKPDVKVSSEPAIPSPSDVKDQIELIKRKISIAEEKMNALMDADDDNEDDCLKLSNFIMAEKLKLRKLKKQAKKPNLKKLLALRSALESKLSIVNAQIAKHTPQSSSKTSTNGISFESPNGDGPDLDDTTRVRQRQTDRRAEFREQYGVEPGEGWIGGTVKAPK